MSWCIVDDDALTLKLSKMWLSKIDSIKDVVLFNNAQKLIEALQKKELQPEVVVLDLQMPIMTGWEFLEEIKKQKLATFKVIVCSSSSEKDDRELQIKYDFVTGYIEKPITDTKVKALM